MGKLGEKLIAEDLQDMTVLWHKRAFKGRKGRGAMDSVMLMDQLRNRSVGKDVHGRDIHSAFNSIDTEIMCNLIEEKHTKAWVKDFLKPRTFQIKTNKIIGEATMTRGTPQGSPLSPSLFTVYMSAMIRTWTRRTRYGSRAADRGQGKLSWRNSSKASSLSTTATP